MAAVPRPRRQRRVDGAPACRSRGARRRTSAGRPRSTAARGRRRSCSGSQVWLTTATPDGKQLSALALDKDTGKILHDLKLFDVATPQFAHAFNTYASPTPVIEPGRVYVTFGSPGTAAIDTATGKVVWERRDLECNHFRGAGSSPILFGNLLLMHFDGSDVQYVVALDKRTGKTVWKTDRSVDFQDLEPNGKPKADGDFRKAFATPQIVMVGHDARCWSASGRWPPTATTRLTGKELWRVEERGNFSSSTRPVAGHGLVYYPDGFQHGADLRGPARRQRRRDRTHVAWKLGRGAPNKPSLLLLGDLLFMVNDGGIVTCHRREDRRGGVARAADRQLLGVAASRPRGGSTSSARTARRR